MSSSSANPITKRVSQKMKKKGQTSANEDPTEGDGRRWAKGAKYLFLLGRLVKWHDARDSNEMSTFYSRITLLFIRAFSWEHALEGDSSVSLEEPSEENLDAVLDVTGLTAEEISRRNLVYLDLRSVRLNFSMCAFLSMLTRRLLYRNFSAGSATTGPSR